MSRPTLDKRFLEANTQHRIRSAVLGVLDELGYEKAHVKDIVGAAHVARKTFYGNFPGGKEEVARAALLDALNELIARTPTLEKVRDLNPPTRELRVVLAEAPRVAPGIYEEWLNHLASLTGLADPLDQAVAGGMARLLGHDPEHVVDFVYAVRG